MLTTSVTLEPGQAAVIESSTTNMVLENENTLVVTKTAIVDNPFLEDKNKASLPQPETANTQAYTQSKPAAMVARLNQPVEATPGEIDAVSREDSTSISRTNQTFTIDLPLKSQGFYLGDVSARLGADNKTIKIKLKTLEIVLGKIVKPQLLKRLSSLSAGKAEAFSAKQAKDHPIAAVKAEESSGKLASFSSHFFPSTFLTRVLFKKQQNEKESKSDLSNSDTSTSSHQRISDDYYDLATLKQNGFDLAYDAQASELSITLAIDQRIEQNIQLASTNQSIQDGDLSKPAYFSAYMNMAINMDYVAQSSSGGSGLIAPHFDFEGAVRIGSIVIEGENALAPTFLPNQKHAELDGYNFVRRGTRFVYDMPEEVVRYKFGDLITSADGFQSSSTILGLEAERSYTQLRPGQNIRPAGQHSFRIEQPSNVDILVDGTIIRKMRLQPGVYNLNDLPLKPGTTKVTLIVQDDLGQRSTIDFTDFSAQNLLADGIDEWNVAAGIQAAPTSIGVSSHHRYLSLVEPEYSWAEPIVNASYRRGLSSAITIGSQFQGDKHGGMIGSSLGMQTVYGYIGVDIAGSYDDIKDLGAAGRIAYETTWGRDNAGGSSQSLRLSADYESTSFHTAGHDIAQKDHVATLVSQYSRDLDDDTSATFGAALSLTDETASNIIARWNADLTLSHRFSNSLSGSFSTSYGQDSVHIHRDITCVCEGMPSGGGLTALARLSIRPDQTSTLTLNYDAQTQSAHTNYTQSSSTPDGNWQASADIDAEHQTHSADVNGSLDYVGNRGSISLNHETRLDGFSTSKFTPQSRDERTSLRLASGFAIADGAMSFGKPIDNSFAIVDTHENLGSRSVLLGNGEQNQSKSDSLAPALLSDLTAYSQRHVFYDVTDLPDGYNLGRSSFAFNAPYKSGFHVQAGSDHTVMATGQLKDKNNSTLSFLSGTIKGSGKDNTTEIEFFTNKTGQFGAQGLSPGSWNMAIETETEIIHFTFNIPDHTSGLLNLGELRPQT